MTTCLRNPATLDTEDFNVLNFEQVCRLDGILNETMDICGVCGLPRISVTIKDFVLKLKYEFVENQFPMLDIRLNGGAAAAVLDSFGTYQFNDIDILISFDTFEVDDEDLYFNDTIRLVLNVIENMLQPMSERTKVLFRHQKLSYIQKLIRIQNPNNGDSWSLLSLGGGGNDLDNQSRKIDIKFTKRIQRQYEFSIDSFQIVLDSLLTFYEALFSFSNSNVKITENFFPTVSVYSKWDNLSQALDHLVKRLIVTTQPEKIRGGGLLKYCKLIVQGFSVLPNCNVSLLERYMCSRFFIDYADLESQQRAIEGFLKNHFCSILGKIFLEKLQSVILTSSVCLMKNEKHQILKLVQDLVVDVNRFYSFSLNKRVLSAENIMLQYKSSKNIVIQLNEYLWRMDSIVDESLMFEPAESSMYNSLTSSLNTSLATPLNMSPSDFS